MKIKDLQEVIRPKYEDGETPTKIFQDLKDGLCLTTIKRSSVLRLLREDHELYAYKMVVVPKLTAEHKNKRE